MREVRLGLACLSAGAMLPSAGAAVADKAVYRVSGSCDGLPRIAIQTAPGYCLGLVAMGLKFPRGLPAANAPCPETLGQRGHGLVREYDFDWASGQATGWRALYLGRPQRDGSVAHKGVRGRQKNEAPSGDVR